MRVVAFRWGDGEEGWGWMLTGGGVGEWGTVGGIEMELFGWAVKGRRRMEFQALELYLSTSMAALLIT